MTRHGDTPRLMVLGFIFSAGISCGSGDAEAVRAARGAAGSEAGSARFHVVLGGGPHAGTYDVVSETCLSGVQKEGAWNATWSVEITEKGKISGIITGIDPRPTVAGAEATAAVSFGQDDDQVLYEILKPVATVTDHGSRATLTFKGTARTVSYLDGRFGDGGEVEITVECGAVMRG